MKKSYLIRSLQLFFVYTLLWLTLSGGVYDLFALVSVTLLSIATPFIFSLNAKIPNLFCIFKLFIFFIFNSTKGALQVSKLALSPKHCLTPFVYELPLQTQEDFTTVMLANIYSLMPGTVSMGLSNQTLWLHIIDQSLFDEEFLQSVQTKVIEALENRS